MKKLLLLLALLPSMLWAENSGSLFVNNKNGLNERKEDFTYLGKEYTAKQMEGDKNCYYYMDNATNTKYLFMDKASIRFIQGTKSMTNLIIVLRGDNTVECGNHSCIGLEKGSLTIDSEDGQWGTININQTGSYRCVYASAGGITFGPANIRCTTKNESKACISQEGSKNILTLNGAYLYTKSTGSKGTWLYARGIKTRDCGLPATNDKYVFNQSDGYIYKNGERWRNPMFTDMRHNGMYRILDTTSSMEAIAEEPTSKMPSGYWLGDITSYHVSPYHTAHVTIDNKTYDIYRLESGQKVRVRDGVYYCPDLKAFVFFNGSMVDYMGTDGIIFRSSGDLKIYAIGTSTIAVHIPNNIHVSGTFLAIGNLLIRGLETNYFPKATIKIFRDTFLASLLMKFNKSAMYQDINIQHVAQRISYNLHHIASGEGFSNRVDFVNSQVFRPGFNHVHHVATRGCGIGHHAETPMTLTVFQQFDNCYFFKSPKASMYSIVKDNYYPINVNMTDTGRVAFPVELK